MRTQARGGVWGDVKAALRRKTHMCPSVGNIYHGSSLFLLLSVPPSIYRTLAFFKLVGPVD